MFQIPILTYHALWSRCMLPMRAGASTELFIVQCARGEVSSPGRVDGSSRAMLATARPSCIHLVEGGTVVNLTFSVIIINN